jgi:hypothetical protein
MTLFGEAHILFGWVAPVFILVFCAFLGGLVRLGSWIFENFPLGRALFMIVMMRALYFWFEGFGIDMVIILRILHTGIFVLFILGMAYLVAREAVGRMRD